VRSRQEEPAASPHSGLSASQHLDPASLSDSIAINIAVDLAHRLSGVTREDLDQVPDDWLSGIRVVLRADHTLVITTLESNEHHAAREALSVQPRHVHECHRTGLST
jgi:hypothetical protein